MNKTDIIEFFDRLAPAWDQELIRNDAVISKILDAAGISEGKTVLDVACGTGVPFQDYLNRQVKSVSAIDISPEMVKIARQKWNDPRIRIFEGDVQEAEFSEAFDCIVVYNAFPHFPEPEKLLAKLSEMLTPSGRVTIAHGMSRERIDAHHKDSASKVSVGLMEADALAALMRNWFDVDVVISDEEKYIVSGKCL